MKESGVIHRMFRSVSSRYPERVCSQIKRGEEWERWTYKRIEELSLNVAGFLAGSGLKKGDRAAICMENRPEWGAVYFGIMTAGLVCIPLDPQLTSSEISNLIGDSGARVLFLSGSILEEKDIWDLEHGPEKVVTADPNGGNGAVFLGDIGGNVSGEQDRPEVLEEDIASIIYTSGTTGEPKGVMLTHGNFCRNFGSIRKMGLFTETDNVISILPLHHAYPFMVTLLTPVFSAAKITYITSLRSEEMLGAMRESGVTILVGVPKLYSLFYDHMADNIKKIPFPARMIIMSLVEVLWLFRKISGINLSKKLLSSVHSRFGKDLRFFATGGAKMNEAAARFLVKMGFTILEGYGLTETAPVAAFNPLEKQKIGSAGTAVPDVEIMIREPDSLGVGEVLIKGPNVMKGYYKKKKETDEVLKEGWFYSGDLGRVDEDGYLYIAGRKKETIVLSSGKNIYPDEVEAHYAKSRYIKEICVLGIGAVGEEEKLGAVVVPDTEKYRESGESDLYSKMKWEIETLSESLPAYTRVSGFIVVKEDLPRTRLSKIKRFEVKEKYLEDLREARGRRSSAGSSSSRAKDDEGFLSSPTSEKIIKVLEVLSKTEETIHPSDHLELDLSIDSLGRVELAAALERDLGIHVPDGMMARIFTVKELVAEVEKLGSGAVPSGMSPHPEKDRVVWSNILQEDPARDIVERLYLSPGKMGTALIFLFPLFFISIYRSFWKTTVSGVENIPKNGRCILCANHGSYLDGVAISSSLPAKVRKNVFFIGYRIYFDVFPIRDLIRFLRVIPIDSGKRLVEAMKASSYVLRHGKMVCIFPEGIRSSDGKVHEFKKGVGILAKELNVPIIPVGITGSYESWPRTRRFPKPGRITINFGKALTPEELGKKGSALGAADDQEAITLGIREEVKKVKGEK